MFGFDLTAFPIWANFLIFAIAAAAVWWAGSLLTPQVDAISDKTGIGKAFAGMLLLGGITSLPEIATVGTASFYGNASLATNNLLGSLSINILLITGADALVRRYAITSVVAGPSTMLQGALGIITLALVTAAVVVGDRLFVGLGIWSILIGAFVVSAFWLSSRYAERAGWRVDRSATEDEGTTHRRKSAHRPQRTELERRTLSALVLATCATAAVILVAGYALARTGDVLAQQTGIGASFVGLLLVGFATSLPEVSAITSAVRLKRFEMAIGDVFGTNIFNLGLLLLADAVYTAGPVLNEAGRFEAVAALLGLVLTAIYLVGLLERHNRTIFGLGYDSFAIICVYIGGLALLYAIR